MGSKHRLLTWLHEIFADLDFDSALDPFCGSGCVPYLLKRMGKQVHAADTLELGHQIARATVENSHRRLDEAQVEALLTPPSARPDQPPRRFIEETFGGIFFTLDDLRFLDTVWARIDTWETTAEHHHARALVLAALARACMKRQPRGVFTVAGDPERYKDGRRDLRLPLSQLFRESLDVFQGAVFDNGRDNRALRADVFALPEVLGKTLEDIDLVYLDPPYVPRADDNCYIKRYHFVEGLMSWWRAPDAEILSTSRVKKLKKRRTPFGSKRTALDAFERLFAQFRDATVVLSYSSNGFPDLDVLCDLLQRHKPRVDVHERPHRYHFGNHAGVDRKRTLVREYVLVGRS